MRMRIIINDRSMTSLRARRDRVPYRYRGARAMPCAGAIALNGEKYFSLHAKLDRGKDRDVSPETRASPRLV